MNMISKQHFAVLLFAAALSATGFAQAQSTVSIGLDYSEGKYGEAEKSTTWAIPVSVKHETGPWILKLSIPYLRSSGIAAAGGDRMVDSKQTQSGIGDLTASAFYSAYTDASGKFGIDLGTKIKFATADRAKELLTTGENDYSLQADFFRALDDVTLFGNFGWTKKGDTAATNFSDPWYAGLGFSSKLNAANSWGASYDYREKVTPRGSPGSELLLFAIHKYSKALKVQVYAVRGFSDASPDLGLGATVSHSF